MHQAYAAAQLPFLPPMMPFFGQMPPHLMPPTAAGPPPYVPGPGRFPFMPPSTMFPAAFASIPSLSTVASSVTPTSVVWAGVTHPVPSATVQSSSASEVRSSLNVQSSSASTSNPIVTVSTSQPTVSSAFTPPSAPQSTTVASAAVSTSHTSHSQTAPAAATTDRDDDPVLSASELRRRQRTSPQVTVRTVRQPAELPNRASSHILHLFGNVVLLILILCICFLLAYRLCIIAGHL